jgi:hypothetical protein
MLEHVPDDDLRERGTQSFPFGIVQVSVLHIGVHTGGIKSPQLQGRDERHVRGRIGCKAHIKSVSGGRQDDLALKYWICSRENAGEINHTCQLGFDFHYDLGRTRQKGGVIESGADQICLEGKCRQDVAALGPILWEVAHTGPSRLRDGGLLVLHLLVDFTCEYVACVWYPCDVVLIVVSCSRSAPTV